MNAIENVRNGGNTLSRVTSNADHAAQLNSRLAAASDRMKHELLVLADEDGVTIPPNPGSVSKLAERYLSGHGGYLTHPLLHKARAHPRPLPRFLFFSD